LTTVGQRLFLFGGHTTTTGFVKDLWEAQLAIEQESHTIESIAWSFIGDGDGESQWPAARQGHSATVLHGQVVVFGGSYPAMALNDCWMLDPTTQCWTVLVPDPGPLPEPRAGHTAAAVGAGRMLVFGGNTSAATLSPELWCLELPAPGTAGSPQRAQQLRPTEVGDGLACTWSLLSVRGTPPSARIGHSATLVGSRLLVFGGRNLFGAAAGLEDGERGTDGGDAERCATVHVLETAVEPMCWATTRPSGEPPLLRTGHCAVAVSCHAVAVLGGLQPATGTVLSCEQAWCLDVLGLATDD
jgi:hypothetical protein